MTFDEFFAQASALVDVVSVNVEPGSPITVTCLFHRPIAGGLEVLGLRPTVAAAGVGADLSGALTGCLAEVHVQRTAGH